MAFLGVTIQFVVIAGFIFTLITPINGTDLVWADSNESVDSAWDYVYFSSSVYYGNLVGDIYPVGYMKLAMQIESALSFIFHIIVIGYAVGRLKNN